MPNPTVPGRRWFIAGAVIFLLFGAVHVFAVFLAFYGAPPDQATADLDAAAKNLRQRIGPFEFSTWGLIQILNSSYSVFLLFTGALDLFVVGPMASAGRLRTLTMLNMALAAVLTTITILGQFPPPMVFAGAALICFLVSLVRQRAAPVGVATA